MPDRSATLNPPARTLTGEEQAVLAKASRHLIPLMGLLYFVSFLDRVNVSYAALTMNADIGSFEVPVEEQLHEAERAKRVGQLPSQNQS